MEEDDNGRGSLQPFTSHGERKKAEDAVATSSMEMRRRAVWHGTRGGSGEGEEAETACGPRPASNSWRPRIYWHANCGTCLAGIGQQELKQRQASILFVFEEVSISYDTN